MENSSDIQRFHPSHRDGLSEQQVLLRQQQGLCNEVGDRITKTNGQIIRDHVLTLFNAFNLAIGICLALVGAWVNMAYLAVILLNISIGIFQEIHARNMVEDLSLLGAPKAAVVRGGAQRELPVEELVLDDITLLQMGGQVCIDSIVVHGELEVNESLLTGEADPIRKLPGDSLLSGSFVASGKAYARAEHVGADNFAVGLAQGAKKHRKVNSELLRSMKKVTKFTSFIIVPMGILLFLEAYFLRSDTLRHSVVSTSAALLGMLPKGLVLLISITLAAGVIKLSRKRILVQEMHCIETLAHVDMLCLDKTGTITQGNMAVSEVCVLDEDALPIPIGEAIGCFIGAMEDNNATFLALKDHFPADCGRRHTHMVPFSSERKWSGITFEGLGTILVGAPEKLLAGGASLPSQVIEAQNAGQRILCVGYSTEPLAENALPSLRLAAAIVLSDPIRKNAAEALAFFRREGVEVKIISGDNPLTVRGIAKQAGLADYDAYVDLSQLHTEEEIAAAAGKYSIFGRVTPHQKSQLIRALKAQGHTVAMTGDGVNDVLALREADCSIAMAAGSDAAKQVSQLVLLGSDFTALPDIVMEGRRVVNNITRVAGIFFVKTLYSVLLSLFSILTVQAFPFIPIQITLIDLAIEGYPSFFLSFEPDHRRIQGAFLPAAIKRALPYALIIAVLCLGVLLAAPGMGIPRENATTILYFLTGFVGILAVFRACWPLNKLRIFLCSTVLVGFYTAVYLFAGLLNLEPLMRGTVPLLLGLAALCVPLGLLFTVAVNSLFEKKLGL